MTGPTAFRTFSLGFSLVAIVVVITGLVLLLLLQPAGEATTDRINGMVQWMGPLLMLLLLARQVYRLRHTPGFAVVGGMLSQSRQALWTPFFLGLAVAAGTVAQFIFFVVYGEVLQRDAPFPSWADAVYLCAYLCTLTGLLLLPIGSGSLLGRIQLLLDGLAVTAVAAAFSWYFLLGPIIYNSTLPILSKLMGSAYPVGDIIILICLLILWIRTDDQALRRIVAILSVGPLVIIVADTLYVYQTLNQSYRSGTLLDVSWVFGYMLLGLAAQILLEYVSRPSGMRQPAMAATSNPASVNLPWLSYLPYLIMPVLGLFLFMLRRDPSDEYAHLEPVVEIAGLLFLGLIIARQFLALHENRRLHQALALESQQLAAANQTLTALATRDPLTDLPNHRATIDALEQESDRASCENRPYSMLFVDVDHFKSVNDVYGHIVGDVLLAEFAQVMQAELRGIDFVGRWGGEEFLVILPELEIDAAMRVAERLRARVAQHSFANGAGCHVTCSIGVASYPLHARERDCLLDQADRALSAAKRLGRNQCRRSDEAVVIALPAGITPASGREEAALLGIVEALETLVESRDLYTGDHLDEVSRWVRRLALRLGLTATEAHMLSLAGRLHDIGKVGVPDAVLRKEGSLTTDEWEIMGWHPVIGAEVISHIPTLRTIAPILRGHHERWDGRGYPDGLIGDAIPFGARVLAVVDAYGAMTSDRPYRPAQSKAWAIEELRQKAGSQFDPAIVAVFCGLLRDEESVSHSYQRSIRSPLAPTGD